MYRVFASGAGTEPAEMRAWSSAWIAVSSIVVAVVAELVSTNVPMNEPSPIVCVGVLYSFSQSKYALFVITVKKLSRFVWNVVALVPQKTVKIFALERTGPPMYVRWAP